MNRIPKFRAWHKENKDYYGVVTIDFYKKEVILIYIKKESPLLPTMVLSFDEIILEEQIGLPDKNGVEIHVNDIVNYNNKAYIVEWDKYSFSYHLRPLKHNGVVFLRNLDKDVTIIGNLNEMQNKADGLVELIRSENHG